MLSLIQPLQNQIAVLPFCNQSVPAGFPSPAADYAVEDIDLGKHLCPKPHATYIVRVTGDSMNDAYIPEDALLVVDRSITPANKMIVVAVINNEFTVKRFIKNSSGIRLLPESRNKNWKPIPVTDGMDFMIWGVVTKIIVDALKV
jgi:DNA polymerase V